MNFKIELNLKISLYKHPQRQPLLDSCHGNFALAQIYHMAAPPQKRRRYWTREEAQSVLTIDECIKTVAMRLDELDAAKETVAEVSTKERKYDALGEEVQGGFDNSMVTECPKPRMTEAEARLYGECLEHVSVGEFDAWKELYAACDVLAKAELALSVAINALREKIDEPGQNEAVLQVARLTLGTLDKRAARYELFAVDSAAKTARLLRDEDDHETDCGFKISKPESHARMLLMSEEGQAAERSMWAEYVAKDTEYEKLNSLWELMGGANTDPKRLHCPTRPVYQSV